MNNSTLDNSESYNEEIDLKRIVDTIPGVLFQFRRNKKGEYGIDYLSAGAGELLNTTEDTSIIDRYVIKGGWEFIYEQILEEDRESLIDSLEYSADNVTKWRHNFRIRNMEGNIVWLNGMANTYKLDCGDIIWRGFVIDTTKQIEGTPDDYEKELLKSLKEKDFLIKEINHRVKNNMQVISSLLQLQSEAVENRSAARYLLESRNRIQSMAIAHEILYNTSDLKSIELDEYLNRLVEQLSYAYSQSDEDHNIIVNVDKIIFTLNKVVIIGLLVNELVTNSLKHAYEEGETGTIEVNGYRLENGKMRFQIRDDGKGLPEDENLNESDSMGMQIIQSLAGQLSDDYIYKTDQEKGGTLFEVNINEENMS